ncbi:acyl carrier protein [Pseudoalteromonas ardens]|uniref:Carrier domain-containing protein n=1 Tax=Pseudoalteromonas rubra TaxID=43658 RepID=A0A0L0EP09_9GAMM|nr:acyl carrier protein [Pseudoalteromonas sp. R96]KNC65638.1 hypothetical protein AC626_21890 [Pseudoalteromonas rubra]MDK1313527.1 acyl carrier protein [Pseudoalteromonas sp. R96]
MQTQEKVLSIVASLVKDVPALALDTQIADLNISSMQAVMMVSEIESTFNIALPMQEFYVRECIQDLVQFVEEAA